MPLPPGFAAACDAGDAPRALYLEPSDAVTVVNEYLVIEGDDVLGIVNALAWDELRTRMQQGDPPPRDHVAALMRRSPIPDDLLDVVAQYVAGDVRRRAGGIATTLPELMQRLPIMFRVLQQKRAIEQTTKGAMSRNAYRRALGHVASETGISADTLDRWLYPRCDPRV